MEEVETKAESFESIKERARLEHRSLDLKSLAECMMHWRAVKEELERKLAEANAHYDVLRFEMIPEKMEEMGIERVTFEGIGRISLTPDVFVSTKPGMRDKLFAWLRKHKLADIIQPSVNSSTLRAFVKDRMREGKEIPEDCLNVTPVIRASITRA